MPLKEQCSFLRANSKASSKLSPHSMSLVLWPPSTTTILGKRFFRRGRMARFSMWPPSLKRKIGGGMGPSLATTNKSRIKRTNAILVMNHLPKKEKQRFGTIIIICFITREEQSKNVNPYRESNLTLSKVLRFDNSWKTRALTFYH